MYLERVCCLADCMTTKCKTRELFHIQISQRVRIPCPATTDICSVKNQECDHFIFFLLLFWLFGLFFNCCNCPSICCSTATSSNSHTTSRDGCHFLTSSTDHFMNILPFQLSQQCLQPLSISRNTNCAKAEIDTQIHKPITLPLSSIPSISFAEGCVFPPKTA